MKAPKNSFRNLTLKPAVQSFSATDETPAGAIDGSNKFFTTIKSFSKILVYYNGQRLCTAEDFTIIGPNSFRLLTPPHPGEKLRVDTW
jgi:hypothetical protein